jgi:hypothetical protein
MYGPDFFDVKHIKTDDLKNLGLYLHMLLSCKQGSALSADLEMDQDQFSRLWPNG